VKVWELPSPETVEDRPLAAQDRMIAALDKFVAIPSVSGNPNYTEACRRASKYLRSLFKQLGAETRLIVSEVEGRNPLVAAKFRSSQNEAPVKHVLFYGHYDVQPASESQWSVPPFQLTGKDGFLYGRGATDDKGPILATLFAVSELIDEKRLACDVSFLIEGEEESGSKGFSEAVLAHKDFFGSVDVIMLSNSYWINDEQPCLTFGLRGVLHATIDISSPKQEDLHSGVDGGAYDEPLNDMVKVLSELASVDKRILIPGFSDTVRAVTEEERNHYRQLSASIRRYKGKPVREPEALMQELMARWRFPSLTLHKIDVSGPASNTVIPRTARAIVSMRLVPDQELLDICQKFEQHVCAVFGRLRSKNGLTITVGHRAEWWLADLEHSEPYRIAAAAIEQVWGVKPLLVREGGSIPAIPFLEKTFQAQAIHVPMGQASDNAHLPNERIRVENLNRGREVMKVFFSTLSNTKG
jgi:di- and tripeptidase